MWNVFSVSVFGDSWVKVGSLFFVLLSSSLVPLGLLGLYDEGYEVSLVLGGLVDLSCSSLMMVGLIGWVGSLVVVMWFGYLKWVLGNSLWYFRFSGYSIMCVFYVYLSFAFVLLCYVDVDGSLYYVLLWMWCVVGGAVEMVSFNIFLLFKIGLGLVVVCLYSLLFYWQLRSIRFILSSNCGSMSCWGLLVNKMFACLLLIFFGWMYFNMVFGLMVGLGFKNMLGFCCFFDVLLAAENPSGGQQDSMNQIGFPQVMEVVQDAEQNVNVQGGGSSSGTSSDYPVSSVTFSTSVDSGVPTTSSGSVDPLPEGHPGTGGSAVNPDKPAIVITAPEAGSSSGVVDKEVVHSGATGGSKELEPRLHWLDDVEMKESDVYRAANTESDDNCNFDDEPLRGYTPEVEVSTDYDSDNKSEPTIKKGCDGSSKSKSDSDLKKGCDGSSKSKSESDLKKGSDSLSKPRRHTI